MHAQCLSSVNPVGGTENILTLEKNTLRIITFYKYGQSKHYYEKNKRLDHSLISKAYYNYSSFIIGYGITNKLTFETEIGYFFNKTQEYNVQPAYSLTGKGLSNIIALTKYNIYTNHINRIYYSAAAGVKIPFSRNPKVVDNVELPIDLQPNAGAYGLVFNSFFVKENPEKGLRYFITNRVETNFSNKDDYQLGTAVFSSFYISKHLMFSWLKGDWTTILQIRNEFRAHDKISGEIKNSSGSILFFLVPQINYVIKESWFISLMTDIPVYQNFNGTQLGAGFGITLSLSKTFNLKQIKAK